MLEFADITLAIEKPEKTEVDAAFPFYWGQVLALGRINVAKDAYRQTFKRLATFTLFNPETSVYSLLEFYIFSNQQGEVFLVCSKSHLYRRRDK